MAVRLLLIVRLAPIAAPLILATESTPSSQIAFLLHFPLLISNETVFKPSLNAWTRSATKTAIPNFSSIANATPSAKPSRNTCIPMASAPTEPAKLAECVWSWP